MTAIFQMYGLRADRKAEWYNRGYPVAQWDYQEQLYHDMEYIFEGRWLEDTISESDTRPKYPLRFDPFELPVMFHVAFLFGQVPDNAKARVTFQAEMWKNGEKQATKTASGQAEKVTAFLNTLWQQNEGHNILSVMAQDCQVYGGTVGGVYYDPTRRQDHYPIRIYSPEIQTFYPVWGSRQYDDLLEVIIAYGITSVQAKHLGVELERTNDTGLYIEHWKQDSYEITVDDKLVKVLGLPATGKPVGGVIPYVYIPHPPRVGFYGRSLLWKKLGMAKEVNEQMASVGDIIQEEAVNIPAVRNTRDVRVRELGHGKVVLDIGFAQGDRVPDILWPNARGSSVSSADDHVSTLLSRLWMSMYCPDVLFGGGGSSQRSSASFAFMALPLINHINTERSHFSTGLSALNSHILHIAADKGIAGITQEMADNAVVSCNWYPMLPRDVLEEVTSVIARVTAKIMSPETAIEKIGDILDIEGEMDKIKAWREETEESRQKAFSGAGSGQMAGVQSAQAVKAAESTKTSSKSITQGE